MPWWLYRVKSFLIILKNHGAVFWPLVDSWISYSNLTFWIVFHVSLAPEATQDCFQSKRLPKPNCWRQCGRHTAEKKGGEREIGMHFYLYHRSGAEHWESKTFQLFMCNWFCEKKQKQPEQKQNQRLTALNPRIIPPSLPAVDFFFCSSSTGIYSHQTSEAPDAPITRMCLITSAKVRKRSAKL